MQQCAAPEMLSSCAPVQDQGEVDRASNEYGLTPEEYAYRLLEDAKKKGWIRGL